MKRVVSHTRQCKRKSNGGCPICKQLVALCCYHAKVCQEAKCPVHFCQNIKEKLRQQSLQEAAMMSQQQQSFGKGNPDNPGMVGPGGAGVALSSNSTMMIQQQPQHQQGLMMQGGNPQQKQWQQQTSFNMPQQQE
jgi:hypothetical protein